MRIEELKNFCEGCMPLKPACEEETADFRTQLHAHLKTPPTFLAQPERVRILGDRHLRKCSLAQMNATSVPGQEEL